jgi:RHS repeat-associated protein
MNGNIVQQNHFYPFGQTMAISTGQGAQPYKFTGKELDLENGLNLYDFDARTYDTSVGRFTTVDPLAEKYYSISPYAYCANNPVKFVDIDGKKLYFAPGVSKEFKKQFAATVKYMNSKGTGGILKKINDSSKKVYIKEENGKSSFDPNTNTIKWDPDLGVITTNGTILSPATVLNHEADHANQNITNPEKQKTDENTPDANYSNKEEKRVIEGTEQTTARKHGEIEDGEVTRTNHSGVYYETKNPTTTEGKYEAVVTPEDIRKKNN